MPAVETYKEARTARIPRDNWEKPDDGHLEEILDGADPTIKLGQTRWWAFRRNPGWHGSHSKIGTNQMVSTEKGEADPTDPTIKLEEMMQDPREVFPRRTRDPTDPTVELGEVPKTGAISCAIYNIILCGDDGSRATPASLGTAQVTFSVLGSRILVRQQNKM